MLFQNSKNEININTYARQPFANSFEISMENIEIEKPYPTQSSYSKNTVAVTLNNIDKVISSPKVFNKIEYKPCICRNVHRFCEYFGRGWLFPKYSNQLNNWCVADACGSICAFITWMLIAYAVFVVYFVMIMPSPSFFFKWINGFGFLFFASMALFSHLKSMFTNPGAIALGNATAENIERTCAESSKTVYKCVKCDSLKPQRAHHCSICQRCIVKMDHHCPWVNNCIGENNQKYFVLFTFYICIISIYSIYLSVHFFMICVGSEWEECKEGFSPASSTILIIFLLVEGVLFGLFTAIMCGEQLTSICSDQTGIESLKREQRSNERRSKIANLQGVFGFPTSWRWLCPLVEPKIVSVSSNSYAMPNNEHSWNIV